MLSSNPSKDTFNSPRSLRAFLCYSPSDESFVRDLHKRLTAEGIDVWFHEEKLLGGQKWQQEVLKAMRNTDAVIVCVSQNFIKGVGFFQTELQIALELADEQPEGVLFIIPLKLEKLDEGDLPEKLRPLYPINFFEGKRGYEQLMRSLQARADSLGVTLMPPSVSTVQVAAQPARQHTIAKSPTLQEQASIATELFLRDKQNSRTKHITCLVTLPFKDSEGFSYETVLLPALRAVLEQKPYYWQVIHTDEMYFAETVERNFVAWVSRAHAFLADITDLNPNVMMELGFMRWGKKPDQPLIVLQRTGTNSHLADLAGFIRISYPDAHGDYALEEVASAIRTEFAKYAVVQRLNSTKLAHYLSPLLLSNTFGVNESTAKVLSQVYVTVEDFVNAPVEDVTHYVPAYKIAQALQQIAADFLNETG